MTREEERARALIADRLSRDDGLKTFLQDMRQDCLLQFQNSGPADTGTREEAHALLRAITKLESKLSAAAQVERLNQKRERHRV